MQIDDLKSACEQCLRRHSDEEVNQRWRTNILATIKQVRAASSDERRSVAFQKRLWDENPISATGQGNVRIDAAIEDAKFRNAVADLFDHPLPDEQKARTDEIRRLFDELVALLEVKLKRIPWLKLLRVFAVAFPSEFTSVTHRRRLGQVHRGIGGPRGQMHPVDRSRAVIDLIEDALGAVNKASLPDVVTRLTLPWWLYVDHIQEGDDDSTETAVAGGAVELKPLPAARRRRGMLAIGGYLDTISAILEFVKDGCDRDDLIHHIRTINPNLSLKSAPTNIYALISEWGVLATNDGRVELTDRGEAFLESGDPSELSDWLLTRVLGFDYLLDYVKQKQPVRKHEAISALKSVNPGWTSNYAPDAMVTWQVRLGLLQRLPEYRLGLTEEGQRWVELITWEPQKLSQTVEEEGETIEVSEPEDISCKLPDLPEIQAKIANSGVFEPKLIARLHIGLWSRNLRHFAVLSGLSGAGKTLLARAYGAALNNSSPAEAKNLVTIAVRPGWYDPTAILGYINPLNEEAYVSTRFLRFLLQAASDPEHPYVVVLDEMNLSHPEQYMAPLLSAMETGAAIHLHSQATEIDGIPASIAYPRNLAIIGTVNMDETTHSLSDKVLDRAFVFEFWEVNIDACPAWESSGIGKGEARYFRTLLHDMMLALRPVRLHFGWRVVEDLILFGKLNAQDGHLSLEEAADTVVYTKVLPKLRGDDTPMLQKALRDLHGALSRHNLSQSKEKVAELLMDLESTGTARFWR